MKKYTKQRNRLLHLHPFLGISGLLLTTMIVLGVFMQGNTIGTHLLFTDVTRQVIASNEDAASIPTFLRIPSLELSLIVNQTAYTNQKGYGVFHLTTPNEKSKSIIIYGQNTPYHFGRIGELQKGEKIFLVTQDGVLHTYSVEKIFTAALSDVTASTEDVLYLTTEYGFAIQKRIVIKALPLQE